MQVIKAVNTISLATVLPIAVETNGPTVDRRQRSDPLAQIRPSLAQMKGDLLRQGVVSTSSRIFDSLSDVSRGECEALWRGDGWSLGVLVAFKDLYHSPPTIMWLPHCYNGSEQTTP